MNVTVHWSPGQGSSSIDGDTTTFVGVRDFSFDNKAAVEFRDGDGDYIIIPTYHVAAIVVVEDGEERG